MVLMGAGGSDIPKLGDLIQGIEATIETIEEYPSSRRGYEELYNLLVQARGYLINTTGRTTFFSETQEGELKLDDEEKYLLLYSRDFGAKVAGVMVHKPEGPTSLRGYSVKKTVWGYVTETTIYDLNLESKALEIVEINKHLGKF